MSTAQAIYLLSDATGETAEKMVMAALTQFRDKPARLTRINNVRTKNQVYEALDDALSVNALIVYTIVNRDLAQLVHDECDGFGLVSIDLLTPLLMKVAHCFGRSPKETPGLRPRWNPRILDRQPHGQNRRAIQQPQGRRLWKERCPQLHGLAEVRPLRMRGHPNCGFFAVNALNDPLSPPRKHDRV